MADKIQLEITIDADGNVVVKTHGLKGEECLVETRGLETAVGQVERRAKTSEFYEKPSAARTRVARR
jgi:hypothetical protein